MQLEERGCAVLGNKKWVGTAEGHMHSKEEIKSGVHHSHLHRKKSDVQVSLSLKFSILVVSCFMWSGALDSSGVLYS